MDRVLRYEIKFNGMESTAEDFLVTFVVIPFPLLVAVLSSCVSVLVSVLDELLSTESTFVFDANDEA
jgi:hypothetical protein